MVANLRNARFLVAVLAAVVLVFFSVAPAAAQVVTGTIGGTVLDTQGAAIPSAMISITNRDTGLVRTTMSGAGGEFTVTDLPSGPYSINVTAGGFQQQVRNGVTLTVGAVLRLDFRLSVGQVEQTVTVTEEAPQVDTTTSTLSGLVSDTSIRQLPLNGRDWLQLTALQSGVLVGLSKNPDSGENVTHGGGIFLTVSGGRPTSNVFMVDGLVINDEANKSPGSTVDGVNLGVDGIKEFSVLTSTFSAEFGRSSGGVVNAITKSGTNQIHGTAFGFLRNSALDASNYFTGSAPFHRSQFGGALGGPIKQNKLFYFGDYEGLRQFLAESAPTFTISDAARAGTVVFNGMSQAPIPNNVKPYLAMFPEQTSQPSPALIQANPYIAPLNFPGGTRGTEDYALGRIDYVPTSNISIHGTYNFDRSLSYSPDGVGLKTIGSVQRAQRVTVGLQYTIRPTLINTINAGFNRVVGTGNIDVPGSSTNAAYNNTALGFLPNIAQNPGELIIDDISPDGVRGVPGGIGATGGDQIWWTDPQVNDNLVWSKGRNNIRFGFSFEAIRDFLSVGRFPLGQWEFSTTQEFLAGANPTTFDASLAGAAAAYRHMFEKIFGFYVQDDVRVRSNLTVNLGVRYEPTSTYNIKDGLGSTFTSLSAANITTGNTVTQNPSLRDFSPRIGFAWDPTGSGKNSIRAGFGVFNVLPLPNVLSGNINHAIPFFPLVQTGAVTAANFPNNPPTSANGFTGYFIQQNPPEAYKMEWNLDVQRQITNSMSITAAYVGARGVHLPVRYGDMNLVPPNLATYVNGFLTFPAPTSTPFMNDINAANQSLVIPATMWNTDSRYNALQINLVQRVTRGLTFQVAYAWSNSIDEGSSEVNGNDNFNTTDNPYPFFPYLNRGPADWDVPQHVSLNFDYLVPSPHHFDNVVPRFLTSGWELGGIFVAQSGMPFSVQAKGDSAGTGTHLGANTSQRADYIGGPGCSPNAVNPNTPGTYIMAQCFADPLTLNSQTGTYQGHIGDSGRNSLRVPGNQNFDFSLFKNHKMFNEKLAVQFRAEFFNLFNWTDFGPHTQALFAAPKRDASGAIIKPGALISGDTALISPTAFDQREIQFGLKFVF